MRSMSATEVPPNFMTRRAISDQRAPLVGVCARAGCWNRARPHAKRRVYIAAGVGSRNRKGLRSGARFPQVVIHGSTLAHELRKAKGTAGIGGTSVGIRVMPRAESGISRAKASSVDDAEVARFSA